MMSTAVGVRRSSPLRIPPLPPPTQAISWGPIPAGGVAWVIAEVAARYSGFVLVITPDSQTVSGLATEVHFFNPQLPIHVFPDWETLPYDVFSPHQDIVSQRLATLYRLPQRPYGILLVSAATLMQRLPPCDYLDRHALMLACGDTLDVTAFRTRLNSAGYACVSQVMEHGEFAVRGSLLDIFPMGSERPYRIDLMDEIIETIRIFDPETQRSLDKIEAISLLPAREFPLTKEAILRFRQAFRGAFSGHDLHRCHLYRDLDSHQLPSGIEYYLPLFFEQTATLFEYLPKATQVVALAGVAQAMQGFYVQIQERYEQRRHDVERPLLSPDQVFIPPPQIAQRLQGYARIDLVATPTLPFAKEGTLLPISPLTKGGRGDLEADSPPHLATPPTDLALQMPPAVTIDPRAEQPTAVLQAFLQDFSGRVLLSAASAGRREMLLDTLRSAELRPYPCERWEDFLNSDAPLQISQTPLDQGVIFIDAALAILTEAQLYGIKHHTRPTRSARRDLDTVIRQLADLAVGAPVVHEVHGIGRYGGLQRLTTAGIDAEFVVVHYADEGILYVPVANLHLLNRYTGTAPELAPLHKLGSDQWARIKRKAQEQISDVAAELLDLYALRKARSGHAFTSGLNDYYAFAGAFPFDETPDQQSAIEAVLDDMRSGKPMDRVICGDVGFGKTEVAMRAAFLAVQDSRQVAVLVPTTLLAQQHYQTFRDRFADWPVRIDVLSRFKSKAQHQKALATIAAGQIDIVIGTHKLLQENIQFKNLGLLIIDEEQRFGVKQKERLKALRAEVDILTLTATPIPRTLNMALAGLRDLSIIATPPAHRLAVKTFVSEWDNVLVREAILRELKRGGQVYFLHNEVATIHRQAETLLTIVPQARLAIAHGQMHERDLEQVMVDFYRQRVNVLLCSTIIENGIDVPNANTIIMHRADLLGLAQLHQLRGRVGRSHHRAYAYLLIPPRKTLTPDALKRIEAIEALDDLGAGFILANHDLEIRGAGELLGENQSGQIAAIGYTLYMDLLERTVEALKAGGSATETTPPDRNVEIDLQAPALIPEDYLPDVHSRLILYKRIASAKSSLELNELQIEMIDRFGLLPEPTKTLFVMTELKLRAVTLGIRKMEAGPKGIRCVFNPQPPIDLPRLLALIRQQPKVYKLDGQDKLRVSLELADAKQRVQAIEQLLTVLTPTTAVPDEK